jgi:fibronectin-binding autotransporter adhesin
MHRNRVIHSCTAVPSGATACPSVVLKSSAHNPAPRFLKTGLFLLVLASLSLNSVRAAVYYYDTSVNCGLGGATPIGTWASGTIAQWTTDTAGCTTPTTASWATGTANEAVFDGTAATINVTSGGVYAKNVTFKVTGYTIGSAGALTFNTAGGGTITVTTGTATISNILHGTPSKVTGAGTLLLSNTGNDNTGAITVDGGSTLRLASSGCIGSVAAGAGDITLNSGTLQNDATGAGGTFLTANRSIILGASGGTVSPTSTTAGNSLIYAGVISGTGNTLTKTGANEFRTQSATGNSFSKLVVKQGLYRVGNASQGGANADLAFGADPGASLVADAVTLDGGGIGASVSPTWKANRGITVTASGGFIDASSASMTITAPVAGPGTLTVSGTAQAIALNADSTFGSLTKTSTGTLTLGANITVANLGGTATMAVSSGKTLTVNNDLATAYSGGISGSGSFAKNGSGTLTISVTEWANTGGVNINKGSIKFGDSAAGFATTCPVTIASGATLNMNNVNDSFGSLAGAGSVTMGTGNLTLAATSGSKTFSGSLSGSGTLTKSAATATQILSGDNSAYTGSIVVSAGKLQLASASAAGTTAAGTSVSSGAEVMFDGAATTFTCSEPFSIAGSGAGDGGAIAIQNNAAPTLSGTVTLTADATVTVSSSASATFNKAVAFTSQANQSLTLQGGDNPTGLKLVSGAINLGTGSLNKLQGGAWALSAANNYSGGTSVGAGTLEVQAAGGLGSGNVAISGGALKLSNPSAMASSANLTLPASPSGNVNLNFTGTQTVNALFFGAIQKAAGTWNASRHGAFAGSGNLNVTTGPATSTALEPIAAACGGTPSSLTATVSGNAPSGTIEFFDGANSLGTSPLSSGSATKSVTLSVGTHDITAVYSGDDNNNPSTSGARPVIVNPLPATSAIIGADSSSIGQAGNVYSVALTSGSSYAWTVPSGASITAGATGPNNNQITVTFGSASGSIGVTETSATGCVGSPVSLAVTVSANHAPTAQNFSLDAKSGVAIRAEIIGGKNPPGDADSGDTLTVTAVSAGAHCTVTTDGSAVTYTASSSYTGPDSFTYTVSDGHGGTALGTVSVSVVPADGGSSVNLVSQHYDTGSGTFSAIFAGVPGVEYTIETSPMPTPSYAWTKFGNIMADGVGKIAVTDGPGAPNDGRVYRTVYPSY